MRLSLAIIIAGVSLSGSAQSGSRLIAGSYRGAGTSGALFLSDSSYYVYGGGRGGDLSSPDLLFDRWYHWQWDGATLSLSDVHARHYSGQDQVLLDTTYQVPWSPGAFSVLRWTYDSAGRPNTETWFSGVDSIFFRATTYTQTGKPAVISVSQPYLDTWATTQTTFTYNAMDSLTDRVVDSDFISYAMHWRYSPEGWLVRYEQDTPSDPLYVDHYYHPNGKRLAQRDSAGPLGHLIDSTFYAWNSTFDTVMILGFNGQFGWDSPNSRLRLAYGASGQQVERVTFELMEDEWVPMVRQATRYTAFGEVSVDSVFTWMDNGFVHSFNEEFTYDEDGLKLERLVRVHQLGNMLPVNRQRWTYNGHGQLTRAIAEDTLGGGWQVVSDQRYYYEDYGTGMREDPPIAELRVYPNPVNDVVHCIPPSSMTRDIQFTLFDVSGRSQGIDAQDMGPYWILNMQHLPQGAYVLQALDPRQRAHVRLIRH